MKIFQIHNNYSFFGGEDSVVEEEAKLLRSKNHQVVQLTRNNSLELFTLKDKLSAFINLSYSHTSIAILNSYVLKFGLPDIVHIHNIFPLWTNSVIDFFHKKNVPVIMTLHNYRILWDSLGLFNKDRDKYGYFQNSILKSFIVSKLINKRKDLLFFVSSFITLTEFTKKEFIKSGVPKKKLIVKPNFVHFRQNKIKSIKNKKNAIFASRISNEKGILTLIKAFKEIDIHLDILGDGPLLSDVRKKIIGFNITAHGKLSRYQTSKYINNSKFIIVPSECYEGFPITILEAFREGTLVLASNIGSIKSIIRNNYNGILFEHGNKFDLINKVKWILKNSEKCDQIALNAKKDFNKKYTSEVNYRQLIKIYKYAIKDKKN